MCEWIQAYHEGKTPDGNYVEPRITRRRSNERLGRPLRRLDSLAKHIAGFFDWSGEWFLEDVCINCGGLRDPAYPKNLYCATEECAAAAGHVAEKIRLKRIGRHLARRGLT